MFDELDNSVILRGTLVKDDKEDRRLHLIEGQTFELLRRALAAYKLAAGNNPAWPVTSL
jgi:hypothetical protein